MASKQDRIRLYASAAALQQMHGHHYAQVFLLEQGIDKKSVSLVLSLAAKPLASTKAHDFESLYLRAFDLLRKSDLSRQELSHAMW